MRVRIQSLNIRTIDAFSRIIYHQTGIQYEHHFEAEVGDYAQAFIREIKDINFIVVRLFEEEKNFLGKASSHPFGERLSRDRQIQESKEESLKMLRYFAKNSLQMEYEPIASEMRTLLSLSPPLYHWVHSIATWRRRTLVEKYKQPYSYA